MLKPSLLVLAVVSLGVAAVPVLGRSPQQAAPAPALAPQQTVTPPPVVQTKNPVKPTAESQAKAKGLYQIDCAMCHGDNGNGQTDLGKSMGLTMDDWTSSATLAGKQDWELFATIRNGKDKMPSESAGRAKDTDVWNLVIYIRGLAKTSGPAPAAASAPAPTAAPAQ